MAATVAHEIRNPLAGISANTELLREVISDPADAECVAIILAEVERLSHLVTDLLYYSREREPDRSTLDLPCLARTVCELSQSEAMHTRVTLDGRAAGALWATASSRVRPCSTWCAMPSRPAATTRRVRLVVAAGSIAVHDNGGGVSAVIRDRRFDPFTTGKTRGLGLGATAARRCQRRQHGDLELHDTSASGSTVVFTWPSS